MTDQPDRYPLELDEFCMLLSKRDRRVALVGAFHWKMKQNGMKVADECVWQAEFEKLAKQPA